MDLDHKVDTEMIRHQISLRDTSAEQQGTVYESEDEDVQPPAKKQKFTPLALKKPKRNVIKPKR